jgi:predicted enzyme related to lactoylglutathione lyase
MAVSIGYFTIPTRDLARAKTFYGSLFGWTYEEAFSGESYAHIAQTAPGGGLNSGDSSTHPQVWFRLDDINSAVTRVRELGGTAEDPSQSASGWSAACKDDQGTEFNLWQPAPGF